MKQMKSDKLSFLKFMKKDWVRENLKRIVFVIFVLYVVNYAVNYVQTLSIKVDPSSISTMSCRVSKSEITIKVKEWVDEVPDKKLEEVKCRYDDLSHTLYLSLILGNEGRVDADDEYVLDNDYKDIKKIVIEGGALNVHQKTIWYDGKETLAVNSEDAKTESKKANR